MNRFDLQTMAEERVADAAALLEAKRYQAALPLRLRDRMRAQSLHREKDSRVRFPGSEACE
jgi:hypothetical protein